MANEIKQQRPGSEVMFAGTKGKIEARVVPSAGYKFAPIWISGFKRGFSIDNLAFPLKLVVSLAQSFFLIRKYRPHVVVGTGGYVSGPVVFMATLLNVPTLIQEQNSFPGVTTRLLSSRASEVHLTFSKSSQYLRRTDNIRLTGNPTRGPVGKITREAGRRFFNLNEGRSTLLIFGGSLGAHSINQAMTELLPRFAKEGIQVIWQTGPDDYEEARRHAALLSDVKIFEFIDRMEYAYGACDLAVCRAGATTLAELSVAAVPSVLIPYPRAAADHQTENARAVVEAGAGVLIKDAEVSERLFDVVINLLKDHAKLREMAERAMSIGHPGATGNLATAILALAQERNGGTKRESSSISSISTINLPSSI
jgi:UDP-N-acetylglucosamine--N-acetylmuramyl-(pentapeptide) pyrophosphoryl-undecaprenol N-acetylglucosamine transferase